MAVPGYGTAVGVLAKFIDRWADPVRKMEALKDEKKKLVKLPHTADRAARLALLDDRIAKLQQEIARRSAS